jgi:hypothetical protein
MNPPMADRGHGHPSVRPRVFLRQTPRDWAPRDNLGTGGTGRTSSPCDVPFSYASGPIPRYRETVARHAAQAPALRVARPSNSCSLRSAQSRTAPQAVSATSGFPVSWSGDTNAMKHPG